MNAIRIEQLSKSFGPTTVLNAVDLSIDEGEFYALMGPNGSGKTTLASIIAAVRRPDSGRVTVYDKPPHQAKDLIGYVPQNNFSSPKLSVRENLTYFARLLDIPNRNIDRLVSEILEMVGLSQDADKRAAKLSGGMRKRLEVATAFFPGIRILILDEPTTGLDPGARRNFFNLITQIKQQATTVFLITHLGSDAELASRVGLINEGRIIAEGDPDHLRTKYNLEDVIIVETAVRNDDIAESLRELSLDRKLVSDDDGYRIYSRDGGKTLAQVASHLDRIGQRARRLEMTRPSLEDVFFALTDKKLREEE